MGPGEICSRLVEESTAAAKSLSEEATGLVRLVGRFEVAETPPAPYATKKLGRSPPARAFARLSLLGFAAHHGIQSPSGERHRMPSGVLAI